MFMSITQIIHVHTDRETHARALHTITYVTYTNIISRTACTYTHTRPTPRTHPRTYRCLPAANLRILAACGAAALATLAAILIAHTNSITTNILVNITITMVVLTISISVVIADYHDSFHGLCCTCCCGGICCLRVGCPSVRSARESSKKTQRLAWSRCSMYACMCVCMYVSSSTIYIYMCVYISCVC
jgi:hypothetical protein